MLPKWLVNAWETRQLSYLPTAPSLFFPEKIFEVGQRSTYSYNGNNSSSF